MAFTQYNKNLLISQLEAALKAAREMPVSISCVTCANFDIAGMGVPRCRAAGIEIPPEVVAVGCETYLEDHTLPPF